MAVIYRAEILVFIAEDCFSAYVVKIFIAFFNAF